MRKSRGIPSRVFATAMMIWLGLVITDPLSLDACPMHGAHAMHGAAHAAHSKHHVLSADGRAPKHAANQCSCIGDCSVDGGSFATLPQTVAVAPEAGITTLVEPPRANLIVVRSGLREHTLPPANGPPTIS